MQTHEADCLLATPEQRVIPTGKIALKALKIDNAHDPRLVQGKKLWMKLAMPLEGLDDLIMPEIPEGWGGIAIIPPLSNQALFALCEKHFPSWRYYADLDDIRMEQDRPKRAYVIGHRGGIEPDKEHRLKSYDAATEEGLIFLTEKERICIGLLHFAETNDHLDRLGVTITSSLAKDGYAFCAEWSSSYRQFRVDGGHPGYASLMSGPRQVVFA